jgi:hypothetical protein
MWHSKPPLKQKRRQRKAELSSSVVSFMTEKDEFQHSTFCLNHQHFPLFHVFTLPPRFIQNAFLQITRVPCISNVHRFEIGKGCKNVCNRIKIADSYPLLSIRWTFIQFKFCHFDRMLKPQSKAAWYRFSYRSKLQMKWILSTDSFRLFRWVTYGSCFYFQARTQQFGL